MKYTFFGFCLILLTNSVFAQHSAYSDKDLAKKPLWISMIKDTAVNFFDAEHAYTVYFQHHDMPGGENETIGEHQKSEKRPSKKELRRLQDQDNMRMEIKKYQRWHDRMLPYVQADGTIMSPAQRLQVWRDNKVKK